MSFQNADKVQSLYIHWPFCPYKCSFCPFVAFTKMDRFMGEYHEAIKQELREFRSKTNQKNKLKTIYIGGGTPSIWPDDLLLDMFGILKELYSFESIEEVTIEANPGTIRQEQLQLWRDVGITRLSIGVQSLNDQVLHTLTRYQKADDVRQCITWAQGVFHSLSIDLIIGLPEVSTEQWKEQVKEIVTWPIQHISMYFLSVHEGTQLYFKLKRDQVILPPDDAIVDLYHWTVAVFKEHGFEQYEISSFAKKGYESKHNRAYWNRSLYKGFGVGAWSFDGISRFQNEKKLKEYLEAQRTNSSCLAYKEVLTEENIRFEKIMLGLRSLDGFLIEDALIGISCEKRAEFFKKVAILKDQNFITQVGDKIYLTAAAFPVENEIAVALTV